MNRSSSFLFAGKWLWICLSLMFTSACQDVPTPAPTFRTLTPGHSTEMDVVAEMGPPKIIRQEGPYDVYVFYDTDKAWDIHRFVFQDGVLRLIQAENLDSKMTDILQEYGLPEKITWAPSVLAGNRLFIYASQGRAVIAQNQDPPPESYVFEHWYFEPMSLEKFTADFGPYFIPTSAGNDSDSKPEDYWPYWDWSQP